MWCMQCRKHFGECTCPDRDTRMASLSESLGFAYRKCAICCKHYSLCECENPEWIMSTDTQEIN